MINAVSPTAQTVAIDENVLFTGVNVRTSSATCCNGWLDWNVGSGNFTLTKCGIYEISFNANIATATLGALALAIVSNGEVVNGTEMDTTPTVINTYENVATSILIRVCGNSSKTIGVENIGTLATLVKNASFVIEKVA